ncbi:hypothetical protein NE237_012473 [Protea cynaroides]|uniref:Uncharacterized protein n=1 Tax=Protea cynaroides TaxID=273540 RepID=A0A9Q0H072_9MAGN|nr:hypothetical protein NE237_012473 [Protea cynaroides]
MDLSEFAFPPLQPLSSGTQVNHKGKENLWVGLRTNFSPKIHEVPIQAPAGLLDPVEEISGSSVPSQASVIVASGSLPLLANPWNSLFELHQVKRGKGFCLRFIPPSMVGNAKAFNCPQDALEAEAKHWLKALVGPVTDDDSAPSPEDDDGLNSSSEEEFDLHCETDPSIEKGNLDHSFTHPWTGNLSPTLGMTTRSLEPRSENGQLDQSTPHESLVSPGIIIGSAPAPPAAPLPSPTHWLPVSSRTISDKMKTTSNEGTRKVKQAEETAEDVVGMVRTSGHQEKENLKDILQ